MHYGYGLVLHWLIYFYIVVKTYAYKCTCTCILYSLRIMLKEQMQIKFEIIHIDTGSLSELQIILKPQGPCGLLANLSSFT